MEIKVYRLNLGYVIVDEAVPLRNKNPLAKYRIFRSKKHLLKLQVSGYLIKHPSGNIVVDAGWNPSLLNKPKGIYSRVLARISRSEFTLEETVTKQLEKFSLTPKI